MEFILAHTLTGARRNGKERANHKYIKREWGNGRWVYIYKDDISSRGNNRNAPNPNDTTIRLAAQKKTAPSMANKTHSKQNKKHLTETGKNTHNREYYSKYVQSPGTTTRDIEVDGAHVAEFTSPDAYTIMSYDELELIVSRDKFIRKAQRVIDKCSNQTIRNIMTNFATTVANIRYDIEKAIAKAKKKIQG